MKKEVVNITPPKPEKLGQHDETPVVRGMMGASSQSYELLPGGSFVESENKRLQKRIDELNQALFTCQKLLGEMERKSQTLEAYYEEKIAKLQLKIDLLRLERR